MKPKVLYSFCVALLFMCGCINPIAILAAEKEPLTFVGEIIFGEPSKESGAIVIPLNYVGGEWSMNSSLVPYRVEAQVLGQSIEITVIVSLPGDGRRKTGYEIMLPQHLRGDYRMVYKDPDGTTHNLSKIISFR